LTGTGTNRDWTDLNRTDLNRTDLNRTDMNRTDLNRTDLNRMDLDSIEMDRIECMTGVTRTGDWEGFFQAGQCVTWLGVRARLDRFDWR
jgi:uncharacterized protein YjbI with pentapeptide repeats